MAHISIPGSLSNGIFERGANFLRSVQASWVDYKLFRATANELGDLTDRELADLGIHRSEIKRVARDSVYHG